MYGELAQHGAGESCTSIKGAVVARVFKATLAHLNPKTLLSLYLKDPQKQNIALRDSIGELDK